MQNIQETNFTMTNIDQSRRGFLKEIGLATGATLLASAPFLSSCAEEEKKPKGKVLKVGIIGPGSRGQYLMTYLSQDPNCEIIAICDIYQPSIDGALTIAPKAKVYNDYQKLLEDPSIEAVVIATPPILHNAMTVAAFEAGKHVYCEKSLAFTPELCLDSYRKYKESGLVMFVGQQRLAHPVYIKMMEMIDAGVIGEIQGIRAHWFRNGSWLRECDPKDDRHVNWRIYKDLSHGMMSELACHQLQIGTWAKKALPKRIMGMGSTTFWKDRRNIYDNVMLIYEFEDGVKMSYQSIISNKFNGCEEQILGNLGTFEPERNRLFYEEIPPAPGILQMINQMEKSTFRAVPFAGTSWAPETAQEYKGEYIVDPRALRPGSDGTDLLLEQFVQAAIENKPNEWIAQQGYYAAVLSLLGHQAMEEQRTVEFPEEFIL